MSHALIWGILCSWLFLCTLFYGILAITLHVYKKKIDLLISANDSQLIRSLISIFAGFLLINFGVAIRTSKTGKRLLTIIFLFLSIITFTSEMCMLITLCWYREIFLGNQMIFSSVKRLVNAYNSSATGRFVLDRIHNYFNCCGYDEWHREWNMKISHLLKFQPIDRWVPNSCCADVYQNDEFCGYATYSDPLTADEFVKLHEYDRPKYVPNKWYTRLKNDPCPELISHWLGEIPVYLLMLGLMMTIARMLYTTYAVFIYARRKK
ncbi:unnamed protein product [Heterobilharzia americana]|nr:unnamed protein product [Heterobilharzia americana]